MKHLRRAMLVALCSIPLEVGCSRAEAETPPRIEDALAQVLASGAGVVYLHIVNDGAADVLHDYLTESPPAELMRALRRGEIDVAVAWGPLAGYYAANPAPALAYAFIPANEAPPGLTFQFDISLGVRHADQALLTELDGVLSRRQRQITELLERYRVPHIRVAR